MNCFLCPWPLAIRGSRLIAALILLSFSAVAQSGLPVPGLPYWAWQSPRPTGHTLEAVHVFDDQTAIVAGGRGTLLKTTDQGQSWTALDSGAPYDIKAISFISPEVGWLANNTPNTSTPNLPGLYGPGQVRKTVDGGQTWTVQSIGEPDYVQMEDIKFFSPTQGYVVYYVNEPGEYSPQLRVTDDGGQTWTPVFFAGQGVQFVTPQVGYRVLNGFVVKTINGGRNSTIITPAPGVNYSKLFFTDELNGWVASAVSSTTPNLFHTTDGGTTWTPVNLSGISNFYPGISNISFADAQHGIIDNWVTTDGGQSWTSGSGQMSSPLAIRLLPSGVGFSVGSNGSITTTTNFGLTNQRRDTRLLIPTGEVPHLSVVRFPEPSYGWAMPGIRFSGPVFRNGGLTVFRTSDAGATWQTQDLTTRATGVTWSTSRLSAGAFPDRDTAYVAGFSGANSSTPVAFLLRTVDAGQSWTRQMLPTTAVLNDLQFTDGQHGIAVGEQGTVLYTRDAGATWLRASSGTTTTLRKVCWATPQVAYALGAPTAFLKTTDGGATWQPVPTSFFGSFLRAGDENLTFTSATTGFFCSGRQVYRTINGGQSWAPTNGNATFGGNLVGSAFAPASHGWAFGTQLSRTIDGGQNWTPTTLGVGALAGDFVDAYNGWVVGENGMVLHYSEKTLTTAPLAQTSYCAGSSLPVAFATTGTFPASEQHFRVELSNPQGRFRRGQVRVVGQGAASPLAVTLPLDLPSGRAYRLRVVQADSLVLGADTGQELTVSALVTATITPTGANQTVCQGNSLTLSAPANLAEYSWSTGATTRSITVSTAGIYTVRGASAAGCLGPPSAPVSVDVVSLPAQPIIQPSAGGQLAVLPVPGATYQWFLNGVPITGATQPTYPAMGVAPIGSYTVVVIGSTGCASPPSVPSVVLATRAATAAAWRLYPNPASTVLYLERGDARTPATVTVLDALGRCQWQGDMRGGQLRIPVLGLPAGLYMVRVQAADAPTLLQRIVVAH